MPTDQDFLAAICAAPDDDAPRLIYADWLDEQGTREATARAEFIRVQCRIEVLNAELMSVEDCGDMACPGCVERRTLLDRERELLGSPYGVSGVPIVRQPRPEWVGRLTQLMLWDEGWWTFRRGFIEEIGLPLSQWVAFGRELRRAAPLHTVCLTSPPLAHPDGRGYDRMIREMYSLLRRLVCDDEPGDNPVCGLDTLDLSRVDVTYWMLRDTMEQAYRPWRGLRNLILPNWSDLREQYRGYEIEQWKQRIPSLQSVQFGRTQVPTEEHDASTTML